MIIPVVIGALFLGSAFDYYSLDPKPYQIFDYREVKENLVYDLHKSSVSSYRVIESTKEAQEYLGVDTAIALKAINGDVEIVGGYSLETRDRSTTVEIMMLYTITDGVESFPTTVKQGKGWQNRPQSDVGTHYIKAIEYGDQLVISVQFKAHTPEDVGDVRRLVSDKIGATGSLDDEFFNQFESLAPLLQDRVHLTLSVYSKGIGTISPPTKLEDLRTLVDQFPALVEGLNKGKGGPLRLHLEDLHSLQSNRTEFKVSREVENLLPEIQDMYDDIRIAVGRYRTWVGQGHVWTQEQEEKIKEYQRLLVTTIREMNIAIHELDITGSTSQFDEALKAYDYDGEAIPHRYTKELRELIKNVDGNTLFRTIYSSLLAMQEESRPYRTQ